MEQYIVETEKLEYKYPDGTYALKGIDIRIKKGQKVAILGSNGAGKSTMFLHLNGILVPSGGKVKYDGSQIGYKRKDLMSLREKVGIVFQDPDAQLFSASVFEEVSFGPMNLKLSREAAEKRVIKALEDTDTISLKDKPTHFLSYGQKKMVCIAGILAMEPEVIIFDEPTDSLDPAHSDNIIKVFDELVKKGKTVIFSSHDVDRAYSSSDYIFVLKDGVVIKEGRPQDVFRDAGDLERANLKKPWIVDMYEQLIKKGVISADMEMPKTKEELVNMIK